MNPIENNAYLILKLMIQSNVDKINGEELTHLTELAPQELNDAVDYLESLGAVDLQNYLGNHSYSFGQVSINYRGKYLYYEMQKKEKTSNVSLPKRPLNPVGSPYRFDENDWISVSLQKEDTSTLYVVIGMQFISDYYNTEDLVKNIQIYLQKIVNQYNTNSKFQNKINLLFEPLAAGFGEHLFNEIARKIIGADIAIFETSDLNPNVMLEMGVALTWGVKVLPIKLKDRPSPPSDISGQTWAEYNDSASTFLDNMFDKKMLKLIERTMVSKRVRED